MKLTITRIDGKQFTFESLLKKVELQATGDLVLHYFNDTTFTIEDNDYIDFEVE